MCEEEHLLSSACPLSIIRRAYERDNRGRSKVRSGKLEIEVDEGRIVEVEDKVGNAVSRYV